MTPNLTTKCQNQPALAIGLWEVISAKISIRVRYVEGRLQVKWRGMATVWMIRVRSSGGAWHF